MIANSYTCKICNANFKSKFNLRRHTSKVHKDAGLYNCKVCQKVFYDIIDLKNHLLVVHIREKTYPCGSCGELFLGKVLLDLHSHKHLNNYCLDCDKTFSSPHNLRRHQQVVHQDEDLYTCDVCHKTFANEGTLKAHQLSHNGDNPIACHVCHKQFQQKSYLVVHLRLHTGEKPYACDQCPKRFNQSSNLKKHRRIHFLHNKNNGRNIKHENIPKKTVNNSSLKTNKIKFKCMQFYKTF